MQDPQKAIPKGTLLAILITNVTYLGMAILAGMVVIKDAPGRSFDFLSSLTTCNTTYDLSFDPNNSTSSYIISTSNQSVCGQPNYDIFASFPACVNVTESCFPSSCLYEDSSRSNLQALCSPSFLRLLGLRNCPFGLLNNFQV